MKSSSVLDDLDFIRKRIQELKQEEDSIQNANKKEQPVPANNDLAEDWMLCVKDGVAMYKYVDESYPCNR